MCKVKVSRSEMLSVIEQVSFGGGQAAGPGLIKCIENVSIPAKFLESHERAKEHQMIFDRRNGRGSKKKWKERS